MARTRRSPDGIYASTGAVRGQHDGKLPIYICNTCNRDVVWATSAKTGRVYLANVSTSYNGGRYYIGANVHDCGRFQDMDRLRQIDEDDANYAAYRMHLRDEHDERDGHMSESVPACDFCQKGKQGLVFSAPDGGWVHPDVKSGNDFGRYEAAQEAAAYLAEMNWHDEAAKATPEYYGYGR